MSTNRPSDDVHERWEWKVREMMARRGYWKTTDLIEPLAARGVRLSDSQVYRAIAGKPERLNMSLLVALCEVLNCRPDDLIRLGSNAPEPSAS